MRPSLSQSLQIAALSALLFACSKAPPGGWVHVKGGHARIGDGIMALEYEADIRDFWVSPHETTNAEVAQAYNWAVERGYIVVSEKRVKPSSRYIPEFQYDFINLKPASSGLTWDGKRLSAKPGQEDFPALWISWFGCAAYCNFLGLMQGRPAAYDTSSWEIAVKRGAYRLPSDAEWEYAARGGSKTMRTRYAGSDDYE